MTRQHARLLLPAACAATVVAAAALTWTTVSAGDDRVPSARQSAPAVTVGHAADHLPNESATDWVTYADHVVLVSPVSETEVPPSATEVARGEGLIGRSLDLRVERVLWSREGGPAAPEQIDWHAFGWQFTGGDLSARTPLAAEDAPRLEVGHQYVLAVRWEPARCTEGDTVPARWQGLGADAIVPADSGVIGRGELEGSYRSVARTRARPKAPSVGTSLEDQLAGGTVVDLQGVLAATAPQPEQEAAASALSAAASVEATC